MFPTQDCYETSYQLPNIGFSLKISLWLFFSFNWKILYPELLWAVSSFSKVYYLFFFLIYLKGRGEKERELFHLLVRFRPGLRMEAENTTRFSPWMSKPIYVHWNHCSSGPRFRGSWNKKLKAEFKPKFSDLGHRFVNCCARKPPLNFIYRFFLLMFAIPNDFIWMFISCRHNFSEVTFFLHCSVVPSLQSIASKVYANTGSTWSC